MTALVPTCDAGHTMPFTTWEMGDCAGTQYEAGWFCDMCEKGAETGAPGRYHCANCEVDCCNECLPSWEGGSCMPGSEEQLWEEGLVFEKLTAGRRTLPVAELKEWEEVTKIVTAGVMEITAIDESITSVGTTLSGDLDFGQFVQFLNILRIRKILSEEKELVKSVCTSGECDPDTDDRPTMSDSINIPKPLDNAALPDPTVALNIRCKRCRKLDNPCELCIAASTGTL